MLLSFLKSKIHCAVVTEANLHYMGSITIDEDLMDASGILEGEHVHVVNNNNGERIETYVIKGPRGSGCIMCFALMTPEEAATHKPKVIFPDGDDNRI